MRNRFNLNEEDKKHIRGLHGIQQPINEQEVLKKIAEEDYAIAKKEAQRFIDGKFKNKTVNLYTADPESKSWDEERSAMGPWKISQVELIGDLYDFHVDRYDGQSEEDDRDGAELEVLIYFDVIPESKEKEDEYHWSILRERRAKVMKAYWDCSTGQYKGYSDDLLWNDDNQDFAFTNSGLIKDLKSLCNGTNAFTEFNDLFDGSWKLIKGGMDYGMGDEDTEESLA